jgi:hypothetical protein
MEDDEIAVDDSSTVEDIEALGLSVRQLMMCVEDGSPDHLSEGELKRLAVQASNRDVAMLHHGTHDPGGEAAS